MVLTRRRHGYLAVSTFGPRPEVVGSVEGHPRMGGRRRRLRGQLGLQYRDARGVKHRAARVTRAAKMSVFSANRSRSRPRGSSCRRRRHAGSDCSCQSPAIVKPLVSTDRAIGPDQCTRGCLRLGDVVPATRRGGWCRRSDHRRRRSRGGGHGTRGAQVGAGLVDSGAEDVGRPDGRIGGPDQEEVRRRRRRATTVRVWSTDTGRCRVPSGRGPRRPC